MSASASPPAESAAAVAPLPPLALEWPAAPSECVLIVQHSSRVPPAFVAKFFTERKQAFHVLHIDQTGAAGLPPVAMAWKGVVALGGPQGSYEEGLHPWLADEKRFLRAHVERDTPVLGICLGYQLLADALGGRVERAARMEAGYAPLRLSAAGRADPLLRSLFARLQREGLTDAEGRATSFLMHHGDHVAVMPPGVECLAFSEAAAADEWRQATGGFAQAFRVRRALGVQFHPEASHAELAQWTAFLPERYPPIGTSAAALVADAQQRADAANRAAAVFFDTWWQHILSDDQQQQQTQQQTQATQTTQAEATQ